MNYLKCEMKLKECVIETLFNLAKAENLSEFTINIKIGTNKGDNYVSEILQVDVIGKRNNKNDDVIKLICKVPTESKLAEYIPLHTLFIKEIYIYKVVIEKFKLMQQYLCMDKEDLIKFAKCYVASVEEKNEFLIMEDLKVTGYEMFDRFNYLDFEHCSLVMKTLARLHGLSYVLRKKEPETFKTYAKKCKEEFYCKEPICDMKPFNTIIDDAVKLAKEAIEDETHFEKVQNISSKLFETMKTATMADDFSVICHGDCWNNNMLYKYKHGLPVEVCFVDYQIARVCSPVTDIHYFVYHCTSSEFRRKHFFALLDLYHSTLRSFTADFSVDVDEFFPKEKFLDDMKNKAGFGVITALYQLMFLTRRPEETLDWGEMLSNDYQIEKSDNFKIYKERVNGVISDLVYFNYI